MEVVTKIAPLALALIMLALGLGLTSQDFLRVAKRPKDFIIGLTNFLIIFLCSKIVSVAPHIAVLRNFAFIKTLIAMFKFASLST